MVSLSLHDCENCSWLPPIGQLPSLEQLWIRGLNKVLKMGEEFYGKTGSFCRLKELMIENMKEWSEWHVPENGVFSCLEGLIIVNCPKWTGEMPKQLPSLRRLEIQGCPGLVNGDGGLTIFDPLKADLLPQFSSLLELRIKEMPNLTKLLSSSSSDLCQLLPRLEELHIHRCGNLELDMISHVSMKSLQISDCGISNKNLSMGLFPNLQRLDIWAIRSFEELSIIPFPIGNQNLTSLQSLWIEDCDSFVSFPVGGLPAPNLTQIILNHCPKLKSLPERMHILLPSLRELPLNNCPEIECFPEGGLPSRLEQLTISLCERLWSCHKEWGLQGLPSLTDFTLSGAPEEETLPPEDLLLPSTLSSLSLLSHHDLNMLNFGVLQHITNLQSLLIDSCPKLRSLPEEGLPACLSKMLISDCHNLESLPKKGLPDCLSELEIYRCPLLRSRLELEKGEHWPEVAQIPCIRVDDILIP